MAQERLRRVVRRYGAGGRAAVVVALALLLAGFVAAGVLLAGNGGGVTVERAGEGAGSEGSVGEGGESEASESDLGASNPAPAADDAPVTLVVHVDGFVANPGVYELADGSRVADAIEAAGGLSDGADTTSLNLAAPLADGEKVHVPEEGEELPSGATEGGAGVAQGSVGPVNINTAGVAELDALPGVGESTALAIIEDRERNGPFTAPEDLMRVSGIGEKKYAKLEGMICV